jgi:hypothetical protein
MTPVGLRVWATVGTVATFAAMLWMFARPGQLWPAAVVFCVLFAATVTPAVDRVVSPLVARVSARKRRS